MTTSTIDLDLARSNLDMAVHELVGRQVLDVTRETTEAYSGTPVRVDIVDRVWGESRYDQLAASLDTPKATGRTMKGGSQPPIWVDAADLKREIDQAITEWWPYCADLGATRTSSTTVATLHALVDHKWQPDAADGLDRIAEKLAKFATAIDRLFDPPKRVSLAAPCPECDKVTVYRPDSCGDWVRRPALQIGEGECECLACGKTWDRSEFRWLATLIGATPENSAVDG